MIIKCDQMLSNEVLHADISHSKRPWS